MAVGLLVLAVAAGCGWRGSENDESPEAAMPPASLRVASANPSLPEAPPHPLELHLEVGDRFPLIKTVTQTLTQETPGGNAASRSTLELLLAITVDEVRDDGRKRLSVWYDRVRYESEVAGSTLTFDSAEPPSPVPLEARPYLGLADNGFSFWIGPDNRVLEPVGFEDFLKRCVRDVPPAQRDAVLARCTQFAGSDAIADFVDDSIGLLPVRRGADPPVATGDSWSLERRLGDPLAVRLDVTCTLREITERRAEIDIAGSISPGRSFARTQPDQPRAPLEMDVTVRGGRTSGRCTIDLRTGLPLDSQIKHRIDMRVEAGDEAFQQHKEIVTTIRAVPHQAPAENAALRSPTRP